MCDDIGDLYLEEMADFGKSDIIVPKFMKECELCGLSHRTGRKCDIKVGIKDSEKIQTLPSLLISRCQF